MAWAAVAGQHAHNNGSGLSGGNLTVTLPSAPTTGNVIVLVVERFDGGASGIPAAPSVTGGGVASWVEDVNTGYNDSGFWSRHSSFHGVVGGSPSATITIQVGGNAAQGGAASAQEYSGIDGTVDVSRAIAGTSGGTPTVTTVGSTSSANDLVVGGYTDDGANVTPSGKTGAGFTERDTTGASSISQSLLEDKDSGSSGSTQTANMSTSIGTFWGMSAVAFTATGGGGGPTPYPQTTKMTLMGVM